MICKVTSKSGRRMDRDMISRVNNNVDRNMCMKIRKKDW